MKAYIIVEGVSDKILIEQYCAILKSAGQINADVEIEVHKVGGWNTIDSPSGESYRNNMMRNSSGKNLIIFDADADPVKRNAEILAWKQKYNIDFELFLFPNNSAPGAVETLLEGIINPANQCVIDCWHEYERNLEKQKLAWKMPPQPTCPSEKSKIYGYLEALVGTTKLEKEKIKDAYRDFTIPEHWDLNAKAILPLKEFLMVHLKETSEI